MPIDLKSFTVEGIEKIINQYPHLVNMFNRTFVSTYEEFIDILHRDIDQCIRELQRNRENICEEEDKITLEIIRLLRAYSYNATHDTMNGGHVDILIEKGDYKWLGEAKLYDGPAYLWEGLLQLITRYTTGTTNEDVGGLLIYIFKKDAATLMQKWKEHIDTKQELEDCSHSPCPCSQLAFFTTFKHEISGLPFKVRHIPALFYFAPTDKSGRKRKKKS